MSDNSTSPQDATRSLAHASIAAGSPTAWFEQLYDAARRGEAVVPWDRGGPHPMLVDWVASAHPVGTGLRAIVPGVGPGSDAELVAELGFSTVGFDVSATAIADAQARHPGSAVDYRVANLFDLPPEWTGVFDLVVEAMTVQSMPRDVRSDATAAIRTLVAPGGTLLVIGSTLPPDVPFADGPPWRLTEAELAAFADDGLQQIAFNQDDENSRYRLELRRS